MESSDLCKDAIRTCESCLMKFPDDTSLLKHIRLKKKCLERHNMGLVDPTLVQQLPSLVGPKAPGGCEKVDTGGHSITFHSRRDGIIHPCSEDTGFMNSYAIYAFPHRTNMGDSLYSMPPRTSNIERPHLSSSVARSEEEDVCSTQFSVNEDFNDGSEDDVSEEDMLFNDPSSEVINLG
jgi:hypothetical protein